MVIMCRIAHFVVNKTIFSMMTAALLAFSLCLSSARAVDTAGRSDAQAERLAQNNFAFGCDLYKTLAKDTGNVFFSPHSLSNALAIICAGAKGDTAQEIAKVLHVQGSEKDFHASF